jgi:hypothetical protein
VTEEFVVHHGGAATRCRALVTPRGAWVRAAAFSRDGRTLAAASKDGAAYLCPVRGRHLRRQGGP